jgi:two-component system chemotaxis response regulator CheB
VSHDPVRILIVDDSALYRQLIRNVLREVPGVEIVGLAKDGQDALQQIGQLSPDLMTLDVMMPGLNGIDVLRSLKSKSFPTKAVMLSSLTAEGTQVTTDALLEGAFDFILKPSGGDPESNRRTLAAALTEKIQAFRDSRQPVAPPRVTRAGSDERAGRSPQPDLAPFPCEVLVIGTSTGGPVALRELLPRLSGDFPVPILIVQHMPPGYTHSLAERLNQASPLEVVEACDGMTLEAGWAYVAPGGRQMKITKRGRQAIIRITDDPPENSCRPSVDYLFRSAAEVYGSEVLAIILTGMGRDGVEGCRDLKNRGARVIAQHPDGCTVYGMPKAVTEAGLADQVLPLPRIASSLTSQFRTRDSRGPR